MLADSYFCAGNAHSVCQDYAIHGGREQSSFLIVCDGCSGSPHTDVGARLLAWAAHSLLPEWKALDVHTLARRSAKRADHHVQALGLPDDSLNATLLMAKLVDEAVQVRIYGDGWIVARRKTGELSVYGIEFANNQPFYPRYLLKSAGTGAAHHLKTVEATATTMTRKRDLTWTAPRTQVLGTAEKMLLQDEEDNGFSFPLEDYDLVALFTDGLALAPVQREGDTHPVQAVLDVMLDFRVITPGCAARRATRVMEEAARERKYPGDDFGMGVLLTL